MLYGCQMLGVHGGRYGTEYFISSTMYVVVFGVIYLTGMYEVGINIARFIVILH
jgi:hypothetical protein